MAYRLWTCLLILALSLAGCATSYHWSKRHPAYTRAPYGEIAITGLDKAFVLTRTKWFANRLGYGDSTQVKATGFCSNVMAGEFKKIYSRLSILPDTVLSRFAEESLKLDDRIFIKGILPEQGVSVVDQNGKVPPMILLIHEVIIGTDLKRENFFDYALIHNESEEKREVQNISAIVSYTLWDNLKQRPLFSAVDEIQHPVKTLTESDMELLMHLSVQQIRKNLYQGVGK